MNTADSRVIVLNDIADTLDGSGAWVMVVRVHLKRGMCVYLCVCCLLYTSDAADDA